MLVIHFFHNFVHQAWFNYLQIIKELSKYTEIIFGLKFCRKIIAVFIFIREIWVLEIWLLFFSIIVQRKTAKKIWRKYETEKSISPGSTRYGQPWLNHYPYHSISHIIIHFWNPIFFLKSPEVFLSLSFFKANKD